MKRYASIIEVKAEKLEEYKILHASVWPIVLEKIKKSNIRNYSIFVRKLHDGKYYLFSYFEYSGYDFDSDMAKLSADATTQKWLKVCNPCQIPLDDRKKNEWWASMEEVFHYD